MTFDQWAATAVDHTFATFGQAAEYFVADGPADPIACRVIPFQEDTLAAGFGRTRLRTAAAVFEVRKSEIEDPKKGDTLVVSDIAYTVTDSQIDDRRRLLIRLDCELA